MGAMYFVIWARIRKIENQKGMYGVTLSVYIPNNLTVC